MIILYNVGQIRKSNPRPFGLGILASRPAYRGNYSASDQVAYLEMVAQGDAEERSAREAAERDFNDYLEERAEMSREQARMERGPIF